MHSKAKKLIFILIWLLVWQFLALCIHNDIYFASPTAVLKELLLRGREAVFWRSVLGSLCRILGGYLIALICALLLGLLSYRVSFFENLLSPLVQLLKSVPIAAVTVVLLIWWGARNLVLCVSFMVVLPNVYASLLEGLKATDKKLLEMADVFHMNFRKRLLFIYRPALAAQLRSALGFSLGLSFKSGIAAEIIALPANSIGEQLYRDKVFLNTAGVFAWILVALLLSAVCERLLNILFGLMLRCPDPLPDTIKEYSPAMGKALDIELDGLKKHYGERCILDTSLHVKAGSIVHISAPSGSGKTTLLHILAGILPPDTAITLPDCAVAFQEDRLLPGCNALRNIREAGCSWEGDKTLWGLLDIGLLTRPVEELSGGERRRLSIARALLAPADIILLDEPFNGLDAKAKQLCAEWILKHRAGRTMLFVSHDKDDAALLTASELILMEGKLIWKSV